MSKNNNPFGAEATLSTKGGNVRIFRLDALSRQGIGQVDRLPFSIKVMLESCLRNCDGYQVTQEDVKHMAQWEPSVAHPREFPFKPARVILQDFTGVPAIVDLASMRTAMKKAGGNPQKINPDVQVDLVIDHSVQVDYFGTGEALLLNAEKEFERNRERYEFLKWGQTAFENFRVVPPATGIVHQVNLEYLGKTVMLKDGVAMPDSLVGTDSHTTMINGLGVVGWGVGGIEAEACMLGQPIYMLTPKVVGFKLTGHLREGATATDLVLTITQILRAHGVVEKFVEYFGPGLDSMSVADRATLGNMSPEYGATIGFFPVDEQTLKYLRLTGRSEEQIDLVERYCKEQGLWRHHDSHPQYTETLELDLGSVTPSIAGPRRPQDRIDLREARTAFHAALADMLGQPANVRSPVVKLGTPQGDAKEGQAQTAAVRLEDGREFTMTHGDIVIAAITSCTNTSNPSVMVAAGLLAKKAVEKGLKVPAVVKTSLAPGSRVVTDYLDKAGLSDYLNRLGFNTVGYGCTTCIGNSGPLAAPIANAIEANNLVAAAILSGNRNFEGRINPHTRANYLASPPLVVAYAIAGTMDIDLSTQPVGRSDKGQDVFLRDIWPSQKEVDDAIASCVSPDMFHKEYADVDRGNEQWNAIPIKGGELFEWDAKSTYIQDPPFFHDLTPQPQPISAITGARVLVMVGDSVTTDHISPAGSIKKDGPAGKFLQENGVAAGDFNSYGSRRGNDRVMTRGTFANIRLRNQLAPGTEGGVTRYLPTNEPMSIYDASVKYKADKTPLVALAGKDYGMGSSRDWAAKGTLLLGIRAVIAESFERIHRSNLVGMGVLPLVYEPGQTRQSLGLTGEETYEIQVDDNLKPKQKVKVIARGQDGKTTEFTTICRIDTPIEIEYYRNGGILHTVLRRMLK